MGNILIFDKLFVNLLKKDSVINVY